MGLVTVIVCIVIGVHAASLIGLLFPDNVLGVVCRAVVSFAIGMVSAEVGHHIAKRNDWL
jgi:hypothetical protein